MWIINISNFNNHHAWEYLIMQMWYETGSTLKWSPGPRVRSMGFSPSSIYFNDMKAAFGIRSQPCGHSDYMVIIITL